ncbi:hypothetical protein VTJ04DRAFT_8291 [Mycothermus thermophilus]|uniref:uncharacterized protein n=1 Tax=Humicola insolens TaxID=85995 RepID=UPI0037439DCE
MASAPFDMPAPGGSYTLDIYHDPPAPRPPPPALPGGPCNYTDQTLPRCGCRRFWSRASLASGVFQDPSNLAEICMCSHHACFHEDRPAGQSTQQQSAPVGATPAGQENQRPRTSREPLSQVPIPAVHAPNSLGTTFDFGFLDFHQPPASGPRPDLSQDRRPGQDSPIPDTFDHWSELARFQLGPQANGFTQPGPPSVMSPPPPPPSTTASSQVRYLRPFAGKGLQTLSGVPGPRPDSRLTERGAQDGAGAAEAQEGGQAPNDAGGARLSPSDLLPSQDRSVLGPDAALQKLADKLDSHEQRLERIEANSFSVAGQEDCAERHEALDLRVSELESRVDEVEKILNDCGSVVGSRRGKGAATTDDATASVVSVSTDATAIPQNRTEVYAQLQQLQAQVNQLQACVPPTYAKPWELEVVFLPFPLKGIWIEAKEFANHQRRSVGPGAEGWTQLPNTISRATPDPQSPKIHHQEWAGQGPDSNWLLPRAFVNGRMIDQRLRSRGLIKTVLVRGADARSVHLAIHDAFEHVLRISANTDTWANLVHEYPLADFLGLRHPWVPLRKLHKDSRLRFLSPAEMATPALWDFTFLFSSVVMKASGIQRLYITQPEAYLQDHPIGLRAMENGWTWQKLRQLSRVYPDSQSSTEVPEADAMEECWTWNDRLDEPPGVPSVVANLRQTSLHQRSMLSRSSTEPSGQFYTGQQSPILSTSGPSRSRAGSPLVQLERKESWPPRLRTGSLPPVAAPMPSPAQSRRRISSHAATPYERRPSPFVARPSPRPSPRLGSVHQISIPSAAAPMSANAVKRRFSRSPSLAPRNTPRWSRTSRSPSLAPGGPLAYHDERDAMRGQRTTTPFYYATPHSDAVPEYGYRGGSRAPSAAPSGAVLLRSKLADDDDEDMNDFGSGSGWEMDTDPYDDEEEEDEDYEDDEDQENDRDGDSEMTGHPSSAHRRRKKRRKSSIRGSNYQHRQPAGSFGFAPDAADLEDIDVYEDENGEDDLDAVDTDAGGNAAAAVWHGFEKPTSHSHSRSHPQHHSGSSGSRHRRANSRTSQRVYHHHHPYSNQHHFNPHHHHHHHHQQPLRPEDIPWQGIEDNAGAALDGPISSSPARRPNTSSSSSTTSARRRSRVDADGDSNMSDSENIDPTTTGSSSSAASSFARSFSRQVEENDDGEEEIHIHQDEEDEDVDFEDVENAVPTAAIPIPIPGSAAAHGGAGAGILVDDNANDGDEESDAATSSSSEAPSEYSSRPPPGAWQIIPSAPAPLPSATSAAVGNNGNSNGATSASSSASSSAVSSAASSQQQHQQQQKASSGMVVSADVAEFRI